MKEKVHPTIHTVKIVCACGASHETVSTSQKLSVSVCSSCHPFFTGKQKMLDTAGRVERFQKRYAKKN